jgi:hypothetical protein
VEFVADPADADAVASPDGGDRSRLVLELAGQVGVDGVHEAAVDVADGAAQHHEDGGGDEQPDDGVGLRPAEGDTRDDGEAGEAVGAGVVPVGDEGGGADAGADPEAVAGGEFIAGEPDDSGGGDPGQVRGRRAGG